MTTNTRSKYRSAALIVLLLAIGGGVMYIADHDTPKNSDKSYTALAWQVDPIPSEVQRPTAPVASPVEKHAVASVDNIGVKPRRNARTRKVTIPSDDQISLVTSESFGGNMPLTPEPVEVITVPEPASKPTPTVKWKSKK